MLTALSLAGPGPALVAGAAASAAVLAWSGTGPASCLCGNGSSRCRGGRSRHGWRPIASSPESGWELPPAWTWSSADRPWDHDRVRNRRNSQLACEGNLRGLVTLWLSTATVVTIYVVLWLAGGVGFGDVRLAAATVSAAGLAGYVAADGRCPAARPAGHAIGWRLAGRPSPVPYGPALVAGWLVALSGLSS